MIVGTFIKITFVFNNEETLTASGKTIQLVIQVFKGSFDRAVSVGH